MNYLIFFFTSSKMHFYDLTIKEVLFQVSSYYTDQKRHLGLIRLPSLRIFKCAGYRLRMTI